MSQDQWSAVDRYFSDLFAHDDEILESALLASAAAGLPAIQISANQGRFLFLLARLQRAKRILEIGTLGGYSTIWLGRALSAGGQLVTIESEPERAEVARTNIAHAGLSDVVELRVARASEVLAQLVKEQRGPFDMIFIDADKSSYPEYLDWSLALSAPGTLIIADNVVRDGAVVDRASKDASVLGVRRFNEQLARCTRATATAIQTVGVKGYDGFVIALVTA